MLSIASKTFGASGFVFLSFASNLFAPSQFNLPTAMSEYSKKTVAELQEILKSRSLPTSGKKADLIARLTEADKASQAEGMLWNLDAFLTTKSTAPYVYAREPD